MKKYNNPNRKGFTLVELITVMAIVATLAAIIVPNLLRLIEKANNTRDANEAKDLGKLIMAEAAIDDDINLYNPWSTNLDADGTSSWGYIYVGKDDVRTSSKQMMQMLIDKETVDYHNNTIFQDKLLWIARCYKTRGIC